VLALFLEPDGQAVAEPPYTESLQADVDRICEEIPPGELTLQWDVPTEIAIWEGHTDTFLDGDKEACVDRLIALMERVPGDAEVGMHLCYGDVSHKHWKEPDLALMADFTNAVTARLGRTLDYVHMPIPRDWKDTSDYAALERFILPAETQVFLGLLHMTDGVEGAKTRIAAAREHLRSFGVSTSCGLGRRDPAILDPLLSLHAEAARIP
jgi:methionine synthase II (cobalamin-independent)